MGWVPGEITSLDDPEKIGRVRVRCDVIAPNTDLPNNNDGWVWVMEEFVANATPGGTHRLLKVGAQVALLPMFGDPRQMILLGCIPSRVDRPHPELDRSKETHGTATPGNVFDFKNDANASEVKAFPHGVTKTVSPTGDITQQTAEHARMQLNQDGTARIENDKAFTMMTPEGDVKSKSKEGATTTLTADGKVKVEAGTESKLTLDGKEGKMEGPLSDISQLVKKVKELLVGNLGIGQQILQELLTYAQSVGVPAAGSVQPTSGTTNSSGTNAGSNSTTPAVSLTQPLVTLPGSTSSSGTNAGSNSTAPAVSLTQPLVTQPGTAANSEAPLVSLTQPLTSTTDAPKPGVPTGTIESFLIDTDNALTRLLKGLGDSYGGGLDALKELKKFSPGKLGEAIAPQLENFVDKQLDKIVPDLEKIVEGSWEVGKILELAQKVVPELKITPELEKELKGLAYDPKMQLQALLADIVDDNFSEIENIVGLNLHGLMGVLNAAIEEPLPQPTAPPGTPDFAKQVENNVRHYLRVIQEALPRSLADDLPESVLAEIFFPGSDYVSKLFGKNVGAGTSAAAEAIAAGGGNTNTPGRGSATGTATGSGGDGTGGSSDGGGTGTTTSGAGSTSGGSSAGGTASTSEAPLVNLTQPVTGSEAPLVNLTQPVVSSAPTTEKVEGMVGAAAKQKVDKAEKKVEQAKDWVESIERLRTLERALKGTHQGLDFAKALEDLKGTPFGDLVDLKHDRLFDHAAKEVLPRAIAKLEKEMAPILQDSLKQLQELINMIPMQNKGAVVKAMQEKAEIWADPLKKGGMAQVTRELSELLGPKKGSEKRTRVFAGQEAVGLANKFGKLEFGGNGGLMSMLGQLGMRSLAADGSAAGFLLKPEGAALSSFFPPTDPKAKPNPDADPKDWGQPSATVQTDGQVASMQAIAQKGGVLNQVSVTPRGIFLNDVNAKVLIDLIPQLAALTARVDALAGNFASLTSTLSALQTQVDGLATPPEDPTDPTDPPPEP